MKVTPEQKIEYGYDNFGRVTQEIYQDKEITYQYSLSGELNKVVYNGSEYFSECDESGTVIKLYNANGALIVEYTYNGGTATIHTCSAFNDSDYDIGSANKIRLYSLYFDDETGYYYTGGRFFDAESKQFVDKVSRNDYSFGSFVLQRDSISTMASNITYRAEYLLNVDTSYGVPIASSSTWCNNLSDVEVLARLIYGENPYGNRIDQRAVTWIVLNRYYSSSYPDTLRGVATQSQQFATISGNGSYDARNPAANSQAWYDATWLACAICTTTTESECLSLFGKPNGITNQMYFRSLTDFTKSCTDSTSGNNCVIYNGSRLKNIVVVGDEYNSQSHLVNATRISQIDSCTSGCIGKSINEDLVTLERFHNIFFSYE